ncbi:cyclin-like protein [Phakopsora pachyrhizi]|uniref:Transcription initiation factor IIB n=1 Tax=Phakopsora pachyrhizi TaxID=170000 RepID=A0AAV0AHD2_PHAPC|nr:cyclin-like protein [Phakopsora pachyrhizi]CAH7666978.1 cyclin-like protein [Phakopsora pachyrhizi]
MASMAFPSRNPQAPKQVVFRQDLNVRLNCPDCKTASLVEEFSSGDLVCGSCGLVVGDRIVDTRSEWRTFAGDEGDDPSRVGGPSNPLLNGAETFETIISFKDGNSGAARDLNRAANRAAVKSGEKNVAAAFLSIQDMCDTISLPRTVADIAKQLFRRADEEKMLRGKQVDAIIAACIFIACRQSKVGRSFKEIVALTRVPKKQIGQCFKALSAAFETSALGGGGALNTTTGETSGAGAEDLMARFCSHLGLPYYVQSGAKRIAVLQRDIGILAGRSPISVASACIYFASYLFCNPKSAKDIASVAGVSEVTIKIAYKLLYPRRLELVDSQSLSNEHCDIKRLPPP